MEIWANLISLAGALLLAAVGLIKKKERVLVAQCVPLALLAVSNGMLGGVSGVIANAVSIGRNLVFAKLRPNRWWKLGFIALQVGITLGTGFRGPIEALPLLSNLLFTWFADDTSAIRFRLVLIGAQSLWVFYDLFYGNYTACAFDVLAVITNGISLFSLLRDKKRAQA